MAYVISDECVACGTCAAECPAEAISEGDGKYVIDPDKCLDCGTCESVCPTKYRTNQHPPNGMVCSKKPG